MGISSGFMSCAVFEQSAPLTQWQHIVSLSESYTSLPGKQIKLYRGGFYHIEQDKEPFLKLVTVVKIMSWATGIFFILATMIKLTFRLSQTFKPLRLEASPFAPLNVPGEVYESLQHQLYEVRANHEQLSHGTWIARKNTRVFSLDAFPQYVFKVLPANHSLNGVALAIRFQNVIKIQEVVHRHKLDRIQIPACQLVYIHSVPILMEERLDVVTDARSLNLFLASSNRSKTALRQLTTLIAQTGLYDITPANLPLIAQTSSSRLKFAVLDPELLGCPEEAFYTEAREANEDKGLFHYLNKQTLMSLIDCIEEAKLAAFNPKKAQKIWIERFGESNLFLEDLGRNSVFQRSPRSSSVSSSEATSC